MDVIVVQASTGDLVHWRRHLWSFHQTYKYLYLLFSICLNFHKDATDTLNEKTDIFVREAKEGDEIEAGLGLIAPGDIIWW